MNLKFFFVIALLFVLSSQFALSQNESYSVEDGDNIGRIACRFGVIQIGQIIKIPTGSQAVGNQISTDDSTGNGTGGSLGRDSFRIFSIIKSIIDIHFLFVSLIFLVATYFWKKKYWNIINVNNKEIVYKALKALGIILALLSITGIRKLLLWLIGIAVVGAFLFILIRKYIEENQQRGQKTTDSHELERLKKTVDKQKQEIARLNAAIDDINQKRNMIEKEKNDCFEHNNKIGEKFEGAKYTSKKKDSLSKPIQNESCHSNCADTNGGDKLFAETILDDVLLKVKDKINEDSIFELDLLAKDSATLTILPSVYHRILVNSAFVEGCEKHIIGNTNISVTPGKAILDGEGRWVVKERPVVVIR